MLPKEVHEKILETLKLTRANVKMSHDINTSLFKGQALERMKEVGGESLVAQVTGKEIEELKTFFDQFSGSVEAALALNAYSACIIAECSLRDIVIKIHELAAQHEGIMKSAGYGRTDGYF